MTFLTVETFLISKQSFKKTMVTSNLLGLILQTGDPMACHLAR